jgi:signal transduction histidine kinase
VPAVVLAGADIMVSRYSDRSEQDGLNDFLKRTAELSRDTSVAALQKARAAERSATEQRPVGEWHDAAAHRRPVGDSRIRPRGTVRGDPKADGFRTYPAHGQHYRADITSVPVEGLGGLARFEVTSPLAPLERKHARLNRRLAGFGVAALLLGGFGAWLGATLLLAPLRRLRTATSRIAGTEDLDQRVPSDDGPGELRSLAASFNDMLAPLGRRSRTCARRHAALHRRRRPRAAHAASVQATLSALSRHPDIPAAQRTELVLDALSEHRRLVDLLDGLQAMARGDASPGEVGDVDLCEIVAASLDQASSRHPAATWSSSLPDEAVCVRGWEPGLRLLVDNLLENAARHGRWPEGTVRVSVDAAGPSRGGERHERQPRAFAPGERRARRRDAAYRRTRARAACTRRAGHGDVGPGGRQPRDPRLPGFPQMARSDATSSPSASARCRRGRHTYAGQAIDTSNNASPPTAITMPSATTGSSVARPKIFLLSRKHEGRLLTVRFVAKGATGMRAYRGEAARSVDQGPHERVAGRAAPPPGCGREDRRVVLGGRQSEALHDPLAAPAAEGDPGCSVS